MQVKIIVLSIITSKVIVGHRSAIVIIFTKLFAFLQKIKCSLKLLSLEQLNRKHVADIADL